MMVLAQALPDIASPVNYSLVPPWMIFVGSLIILTIIGLAIWYGRRFFRKKQVTLSPGERALAALDAIENDVEKVAPYQFSIRVSDILRRYVVEQFNLPMTRQTSVEFLTAIASAANFGDEEKALLADFLNRCDLIKFARYDATTVDSRLLLDEARHYSKGGARVPTRLDGRSGADFRATVAAAATTSDSLAGMASTQVWTARRDHIFRNRAISRDRERQRQPGRTNLARIGLACPGGIYRRNRAATTG